MSKNFLPSLSISLVLFLLITIGLLPLSLYTQVISIVVVFGCYSVTRSKWFNDTYRRLQLLFKVSNMLAGNNHRQASFAINDTDHSATLLYTDNGMTHTLCVPFSRSRSLHMSNLQVLLVRNDGTAVNITQQPGIPYMVNAEELGGAKIIVTNIDSNETFSYDRHLIPLYCEEVLH